MNIILSPFDFFCEQSNVPVAILLRVEEILRKTSYPETDLNRFRQLKAQAVSVYSSSIEARKEHLDREQFAHEIISLEDSRMSFPENVRLLFKKISDFFREDLVFLLPVLDPALQKESFAISFSEQILRFSNLGVDVKLVFVDEFLHKFFEESVGRDQRKNCQINCFLWTEELLKKEILHQSEKFILRRHSNKSF